MLSHRSPVKYLVKYYSLTLSEHTLAAKHWIKGFNMDTIPLRNFIIRYDRSSGPGGQNVNKVNTKCTLTLQNFSKLLLIPEEIRNQMVDKNSRYYSKNSDSIVIQSDETRSREKNKQLCLEKLVDNINEVCYFAEEPKAVDVERWERISKISKENRLKSKKFNSEKKKNRKLF